ncbi:hypothetical protein ACFFQW_36430 [Umezawaea endophytica]|uniref:Uncharacterized protein n=1 Tax=Umezawaea endophytica TaxID=1654476 RepID=A0A9X2VMQ0_9PSEU|nr:hypothetical protein [Umezawaea endophytica]MCS7478944.1 hypothetical protein [Umezawaea endophytica]
MRVFEEACHYPEFGTLTIRDTNTGEEDEGPFEQWGLGGQPCGTVARAGYGWLEGSAGDGPLVVRLESHDVEPPAESADWLDVLETPYRSRTGVVGLTTVTCGPGGEDLRLGAVGDYRVRVAVKPLPASSDGPETLWALRFWPVAAPGPPRWLRRGRAAVGPGSTGREVLADSPAAEHNRYTSFASDLLAVALWGGTEQTATALAHRTLAPEADVRTTLDWAHRTGLLTVEGVLTGKFTMTLPG